MDRRPLDPSTISPSKRIYPQGCNQWGREEDYWLGATTRGRPAESRTSRAAFHRSGWLYTCKLLHWVVATRVHVEHVKGNGGGARGRPLRTEWPWTSHTLTSCRGYL
eukprot:1184804-Prorocentrum_minimum.AAC.2